MGLIMRRYAVLLFLALLIGPLAVPISRSWAGMTRFERAMTWICFYVIGTFLLCWALWPRS